jgi:hypothetical protein
VDVPAVGCIVRRTLRAAAISISNRPRSISGDAWSGNSISRAQSNIHIAFAYLFRSHKHGGAA